MSLNHLVQRLSITRTNIPPVEIDSDLSILALRKRQQTKESQESLTGCKRYQVVFERILRRRRDAYNYYQRNREQVLIRARTYYHSKPENKIAKRINSAKYRLNNPEQAKQQNLAWRKKNPEKVKQFHRDKYQRRKASMTPEEFKAWQRAKNKQARERKIALIGIEAYRAIERERVKKHYANHPESLKKNREKNKKRMQQKRDELKQEK